MPDVGAPPGAPMFVVIGILIGLGAGAALAFIALYALTGSRLAAARRTRQLLLTEARREAEGVGRGAQIGASGRAAKPRSKLASSRSSYGPRSSRRSPSVVQRSSRSRSECSPRKTRSIAS